MFRDILTNKWVLGGVGFLILLSIACVVWYQHDIAPEKKAAAETSEYARQWEKERKAAPKPVTKDVTKVPAENGDTIAEKPVNEVTAQVGNNTESGDKTKSQTPAATAEAKDVPTSPFGFGPYPEVPAGVPYIMFPASSANQELMMRVRIKLSSQGINTRGATMEDGLVYPVIKGIAYVQWESYWRPTGKVTYISRYKGHPEDGARLDAIRFKKGKSLTKADVPPDIKLMSFEEGAIDPYQFLDLP